MIRPTLAIALLALVLVPASAEDPADAVKDAGKTTHPPVNEMSGIVKSRTHAGVYWVHNDSGDEARLFAIDAAGNVLFPGFLADRYWTGKEVEGREEWPGLRIRLAANHDWEDIALMDGRLYIADVGNNGNARRDLGIYVVNEPDPRRIESARALRWLPVRYPDQKAHPGRAWHFDCEAVFTSAGKLYFLTKHRVSGQVGMGEKGTKLYRLDTEHTDRENVLTHLEGRGDLALPTAADVSPDGKRLGVLTALAVWVFDKPARGDLWLSGKARRFLLPRKKTGQAEALTWDDDATIRLGNEDGEMFTVPLSALTPVE